MKRIFWKIYSSLYMFVFMRIPSLLLWFCPVKQNKVVFINFNGRGYGCNPKYIAGEMLNQKLPVDMVWLVSDMNVSLPQGIRAERFRSIKGIYEVATAKVIITNVKNDLYLVKKKGQYVIQTWHASFGSKLVEKETLDKLPPEYVRESRKNSAQTDLFLSNSRALSQCYRDAFWCECEILECGLPRNDCLFNWTEDQLRRIRETLGLPEDSRMALYAPTFRDDGSLESYNIDCAGILDALNSRGGNWYLLIRMHPNVVGAETVFDFNEHVVNATSYPDMQELLLVADILITDYSSSVFDFSAIGKPSFIFASDVEEYQRMRGLNKVFFEMPYPVCTDNEMLLEQLRMYTTESGRQAAAMFQDKFGATDKGDASKQVVERIKQVMSIR